VGSPRQCADFVGQWREELLASIWTSGLTECHLWVKLRRTQSEQLSSGLPAWTYATRPSPFSKRTSENPARTIIGFRATSTSGQSAPIASANPSVPKIHSLVISQNMTPWSPSFGRRQSLAALRSFGQPGANGHSQNQIRGFRNHFAEPVVTRCRGCSGRTRKSVGRPPTQVDAPAESCPVPVGNQTRTYR